MINLFYDPTRPAEDGNYYLELVDADLLNDKIPPRRFGYWCDLIHLNANFKIINKQLAKIRFKEMKKNARRSQNPVS